MTDDTAGDSVRDALAAEFGHDPRVTLHSGPRSGNAVDNWNQGLAAANGVYAVVVHHDEMLTDPRFLVEAVAALELTGKTAFVGGHRLEGLGGKSRFAQVRALATALHFPIWTLYLANWIGPTAAVVFRRRPGLAFDRRLKWLPDVDFYARLAARRGDLILNDHPVLTSIANPGQITRTISTHRARRAEIALMRAARTPWLTGPRGALIAVLAHILYPRA